MTKRMNNLRPAVFLDRDGTIIEDCGDLFHLSQVIFFSETIASLRRLKDCFDLFIVTNQPGVARGVMSIQDVERVNSHIVSYLDKAGVQIVATYVCPHSRNDGCQCIKPNPYFLRKAEKDHWIDVKHSFVIGDHPHDVEMAINAGATGIYVLTGHGRKHRNGVSRDTLVTSGIRGAVELILQRASDCNVRVEGF